MAGKVQKMTAANKAIIIERLAEGVMLKDICADIGIDRSNVFRYCQRHGDFNDQYNQAHRDGIEAFLEDARKGLADASDRNEILKAKELLRHAEWRAEKLLSRYQPMQKQEVTHKGPMVIGWKEDGNVIPIDSVKTV